MPYAHQGHPQLLGSTRSTFLRISSLRASRLRPNANVATDLVGGYSSENALHISGDDRPVLVAVYLYVCLE